MKPLLRRFDEIISRFVGRLPRSWQPAAHRLGYAFVPPTWIVIVLFVAVLSLGDSSFMTSVYVAALMPFATIVKLLFRRKRPPTIYAGSMRIKSYSFPSSHAYAAGLGGGYMASLAFSAHIPVLGAVLLGLACIIGISRIYLGAHYPSDVIGGWLTAALALWIVRVI